MQPLPKDFLEATAKDFSLSPEQTEALVKRLGDKDDEADDADFLYITVKALRSRMTGVYTKFSIGGKGPGKLRRLHDLLSAKYQASQPTVLEPELTEPDIDALVQEIRGKVYGDIDYRCGTMRVVDMEQKIGIGDIYTSVNILEKLSGRRRLGINELLQDWDLENFDRFMLGQVRHERVPGLEAVERYDKLMILGKPGAGKTTFMKRLATLCNQGKFQAQRVPVFVTLKEFSDKQGKPGLQAFIAQQWNDCGVSDAESLKAILNQGSALVLLDGLDEVQETDHDRVLQEIKSFTNQFRKCQFVMTCRIAAREYTFQQFTEVEVADFNQEQIEEFATKWFKTKKDPEKGDNFIERLKDNAPIQELATNPLLLTLLCLVFGDGNDFPPNRAELYKEGLDVLLKKWDAKRNIERDQVYKKLSLKRKEDLLSQLAFKTFEQGDYFFKQAVVEQQIIDYIRNLPGANEDEEALLLDSEAVLKSIEAQHGLLVERARSIYSFSHLTFQEYFTAKQITSPTAQLHSALGNLAAHVTEKRYREIFLLTVGMLPEADDFLLLLKQYIDCFSIQTEMCFLEWIDEKSKYLSSEPIENLIIIVRCCYYVTALHPSLNIGSSLIGFAEILDSSKNSLSILDTLPGQIGLLFDVMNGVLEISVEQSNQALVCSTLRIALPLLPDVATRLANFVSLNSAHHLDLVLTVILAYATTTNQLLPIAISISGELQGNMGHICATANKMVLLELLPSAIRLASHQDTELNAHLKTLETKLLENLELTDNLNKPWPWWSDHGDDWTENLRAAMIEYRNIGHDWQFTEVQINNLKQYFEANKVLVECLNSDCYVTKATRQYIEDTLLLPMSEIEKYEQPAL